MAIPEDRQILTGGHSFALDVLKALGLEGERATHIVIDIPATGVITATVTKVVDQRMLEIDLANLEGAEVTLLPASNEDRTEYLIWSLAREISRLKSQIALLRPSE